MRNSNKNTNGDDKTSTDEKYGKQVNLNIFGKIYV